jgi:preprotein translocase subunit SecG
MGGGGGTMADSVIGGRQAATLLTKASWTGGGIFIVLALVLSIMSSRASGPDSILRDEFQPTPLAPQPLTPLPGTTPEGATQPAPGTDAPPATGTQPPPATTGN